MKLTKTDQHSVAKWLSLPALSAIKHICIPGAQIATPPYLLSPSAAAGCVPADWAEWQGLWCSQVTAVRGCSPPTKMHNVIVTLVLHSLPQQCLYTGAKGWKTSIKPLWLNSIYILSTRHMSMQSRSFRLLSKSFQPIKSNLRENCKQNEYNNSQRNQTKAFKLELTTFSSSQRSETPCIWKVCRFYSGSLTETKSNDVITTNILMSIWFPQLTLTADYNSQKSMIMMGKNKWLLTDETQKLTGNRGCVSPTKTIAEDRSGVTVSLTKNVLARAIRLWRLSTLSALRVISSLKSRGCIDLYFWNKDIFSLQHHCTVLPTPSLKPAFCQHSSKSRQK